MNDSPYFMVVDNREEWLVWTFVGEKSKNGEKQGSLKNKKDLRFAAKFTGCQKKYEF